MSSPAVRAPGHMAGDDDESRSEFGGMFEHSGLAGAMSSGPAATAAHVEGRSSFGAGSASDPTVRPAKAGTVGAHRAHTNSGASAPAAGFEGVVRQAPATALGWGKGPIGHDRRKFRFDVDRARVRGAVPFGASKADRLSAEEAGERLDHILNMFGINREAEERILGFLRALWFEHTINGASMLQPGRGSLVVDRVSFDIAAIKTYLGEDLRRFYRAFADDIAAANKEVLDGYNPYDVEAAEKAGWIRQVAIERGLQKYPHLAHDSSDACVNITLEERTAVMQSKRLVIGSTVNQVDVVRPRVDPTVVKS